MRLLIIAAGLWASAAWAQLITGTVTGTVRDSSGAVNVGAEVRLINSGTGSVQRATTDEAGNFRFLLLPVGTYAVESGDKGLKKFQREGIVVEADRSLAVPISLEVGAVTKTVNLSGSTLLLEPNTS